jgi:probable rRNA maturation factor
MFSAHTINLKIDPAFAHQVDRGSLRAAARAALAHQLATPGALTIVVSDDATLRRLNRAFLSEDRPTDVLSFPNAETDLETGARYWGDIAISLPAARRHAKAARHPLAAELQLLVVHGVLHLLGHDHAKAREKARMWKAQAEILEKAANRPAKRKA